MVTSGSCGFFCRSPRLCSPDGEEKFFLLILPLLFSTHRSWVQKGILSLASKRSTAGLWERKICVAERAVTIYARVQGMHCPYSSFPSSIFSFPKCLLCSCTLVPTALPGPGIHRDTWVVAYVLSSAPGSSFHHCSFIKSCQWSSHLSFVTGPTWAAET